MNELVYLFELDSVRNAEAEIRVAHDILFKEIVFNGNSIVLTFNQLCDSLALMSLLQDKKSYNAILELFVMGSIKISRYGKYRTAARYILAGIEKCLSESGDCFYFSGLPLISSDKFMLRLICDALMYNDANLLRDSVEQYPDKEETLLFLYKYVKFILEISQSELTYNPINTSKYKSFYEFITTICNAHRDVNAFPNIEMNDLFSKALDVLEEIMPSISDLNSRSSWLQELSIYNSAIEVKAICEGIIHLCYNYTVENSINGSCKQYTDISDYSFIKDFDRRLSLWWDGYTTGLHKLHINDSQNIATPQRRTLVNWDTALRIVKSTSGPLAVFRGKGKSLLAWRILVFVGILFRILTIPVFVASFIVIEYILGEIIDYASSLFLVTMTNEIVFKGIIIAISGAISSSFSNMTKLPDILESFFALFYIFMDFFTLIYFNIRKTIGRKEVRHVQHERL